MPKATNDTTTPAEIKRNFRLFVINGVIYIFGEALLDPTLVLVAFISQLTDSAFLIGMLVPLRDAAWALPQLWISNFIQRQPLKIQFYKKITYIRILTWLAITLTIFLVKDPAILLVLFFISFGISSLANGLAGLPFLELVSKTIPPDRRGELFAWRLGLGGMFGIGGSVLVRWLISSKNPFIFPHNFGMLSLIFLITGSTALLLLNLIHETPDLVSPPKRSIQKQIKVAWGELSSNNNFRSAIISYALLLFSGAAVPFFAVFVQQELGGSREWVGIYLAVMMAANLISNVVFGRISSHRNNQTVFTIAAWSGVAMSAGVLILSLLAKPLGIGPQTASILLLPAYFLAGVRITGIGVSGNSLLLNIAPPEERTSIIGFSQSFLGLVLLATGLNGVIVTRFGFPILVGLTLLTHTVAVIMTKRIIDVRGTNPG